MPMTDADLDAMEQQFQTDPTVAQNVFPLLVAQIRQMWADQRMVRRTGRLDDGTLFEFMMPADHQYFSTSGSTPMSVGPPMYPYDPK